VDVAALVIVRRYPWGFGTARWWPPGPRECDLNHILGRAPNRSRRPTTRQSHSHDDRSARWHQAVMIGWAAPGAYPASW